MTEGIILFAAADAAFTEQVKDATQGGRFNTRDVLTAVSLGLAVGVLLFVWAYFRYRKKEGKKNRHAPPKPAPVEPVPESGESERRRRRKRRRRRDHRPRNPSLQQTGGLPPPRSDDQPPKD